MGHPHVEYLAHHYLLLALPAFFPAVIVAGVVLYVALRDRRNAGASERSQAEKPAGHQLTGQLTMMLVMVGYTFTGLYLLFGG